MTTIHNLGFPRIGVKRELKFALESYWRGETSRDALKALGAGRRAAPTPLCCPARAGLGARGRLRVYDQVLDMSFTLGNLPERVQASKAMRWTTTFARPAAVRRSRPNPAVPATPTAALASPPAR